MNLTNISHQVKMLTQRQRNRTILRLRLKSGIKEVVTRPWKGILVVLLCVLFVFLWNVRNMLSRPFQGSIPLLSDACSYLIALFIPLIFLLSLMGLLHLLGTPTKARVTDGRLAEIGLCSRYGHAPALISRQRVKGTSVSVMVFYSLGVGLERWEKQSAEVQDALDIHLVEAIKYGGKNGHNRNIIVITAAPGAENTQSVVLYDDEF